MTAAAMSQLAKALQGPPPGYEAPGLDQNEILIRYDGHSLGGTPIIYAQISIEHAARIPERLIGLLGLNDEDIEHGFFMQEQGEETFIFIDTDKHEKWLDKVIDTLTDRGVACKSAMGDVRLMHENCVAKGPAADAEAARDDVWPDACPGFVQNGMQFVELEDGLERMAEARRQLEAKGAEIPTL